MIERPIPDCFARLSDAFAAKAPVVHAPFMHPAAGLAHGLCIRMADVDDFARRIADVPAADRGSLTATEAGSLLVGHFGSCKAVLDAAAIALTRVYGLENGKGAELGVKEQDFTKGALSVALERQQPTAFTRYRRLQSIIREVSEWRNAAVHRTTPLVLPARSWDEASQTDRVVGYRLALDKHASAADMFGHRDVERTGPLHFHERWRPRSLELRGEVCRDRATTIWESARARFRRRPVAPVPRRAYPAHEPLPLVRPTSALTPSRRGPMMRPAAGRSPRREGRRPCGA